MAWWYARLLFHGDRLVDAGIHDAMPPAAEVDDAPPAAAAPSDAFTSVCVSGYALYGRLRGYYAIGVGRFRLDAAGRALAAEPALRHAEPVSILTPPQRDEVRAWLQAHSPEAWETSLDRFRRAVAGDPTDEGGPVAADDPGGPTSAAEPVALAPDAVPASLLDTAGPAS